MSVESVLVAPVPPCPGGLVWACVGRYHSPAVSRALRQMGGVLVN